MTFQCKTLVRASRKQHRCEYCRCMIPTGASYCRLAGEYEGVFFSVSGHVDCCDMWNAAYPVYAEYSEGMPFDLYEAVCGDEARDYALYELGQWRGQFPHAVCRIELRLQIGDQRAIERHKSAGFEPDLEPWEVLHS